MANFSWGPMKGLLRDLDNRNSWTVLKGRESLIAGAGAGLVSSIVTCPLDVIKTKLQAQGVTPVAVAGSAVNSQNVEGVMGTVRQIWYNEGMRGLYRGLAPTIYGYLPTWAIYFTVYDRVKAELSLRRNGNVKAQDPVTHVIAAMAGGASGTIVTNPLWVIKTRFMTQSLDPGRPPYRHTLDAIRQIYRTEGVGAFYKGLVPSLFGIAHVAVQFPLYEQFKSWYDKDPDELGSSEILLCSAGSKAIASVTTYPHEVVRTRLQIQRSIPTSSRSVDGISEATTATKKTRNILQIIKDIAAERGIKGFYRGLTVNLFRTVPASALTILTYELLMRNLHKLTDPIPDEKKANEDTQASS
ncbi:mitochondrial carrier [Cystobasidium minutum MCA 4210]|uniref:mitochondrial carrier n=1 Tax=Cystobasidium minutum MCA 4210 TaxID=1397322 RepID=UPI0034CD7E2F|eukprot:jgi/Rhomi1/174249/fgenesh1_kg.7_\